jgi:cobaltochelatase CobS
MKQSVAEVFGIEGIPASIEVEVRDETNEKVPVRDDRYLFRRDVLSDILAWVMGATNDPLYLAGPTGCGKSSLVTQVANRLDIPLYVISCHERMEIPELFGRYVVRNGEMIWMDGPLIQGLKDQTAPWILLDEVDTLEPGTFTGLNALLEGRSIIVPETGEVINPQESGARIICAGNTSGGGDGTGFYQATKQQNLATMGRFMVLEIPYPSPGEEVSLLGKIIPQIPQDTRENMVRVANDIRRLFQGGEMEVTIDTRSLIRWANLAYFFRGKPDVTVIEYALDRAVGFRATETSRQTMYELVQRIFGY